MRTLIHPSRPRMLLAVLAAASVALVVLGGLGAGASWAAMRPAGPSVSTSTVGADSTLTVDFATDGASSSTDWIGIYSSGAVASACPSPATHWQYTSSGTHTAGSTSVATGSLKFDTTGWSLGTYSVYLCRNDGYASIGTPLTVSVVGLTVANATVPQGSRLTFQFDASIGLASTTNWVGLYSVAGGSAPGKGAATQWGYSATGTRTAPPSGSAPAPTGTVSFDTAGWAAGSYTAYLLYDNGYTVIGSPLTITVGPPDVAVAGKWASLPTGFVTDTFHLPARATAGGVNQPLIGLWNGSTTPSFTKISGDSWLAVDSTGVVIGTAPNTPTDNAGEITVEATDGRVTSRILVEVSVAATPDVQAASWNAWGGGANVTDAVGKTLQAIASRGTGLIGFQDGGAKMATQVAAALGWQASTSGDLGIVSAYPLENSPRVESTSAVPALAVTIAVNGHRVRVWDTYLDESATDTAARARTARDIAGAVTSDGAAMPGIPVIVLGDLGSPDAAAAFSSTGLIDTYRQANPDASSDPGNTWPVFTSSASGALRVDYVFASASGVTLVDSDELSAGRPSASAPANNSWPSDHAAVVSTFRFALAATTRS